MRRPVSKSIGSPNELVELDQKMAVRGRGRSVVKFASKPFSSSDCRLSLPVALRFEAEAVVHLPRESLGSAFVFVIL